MSQESDSIKNPHELLLVYKKQAQILNKAYVYGERFYKNISNLISIPLLLISCVNSAISIIPHEKHGYVIKYILIGLNLLILMLISLQSFIKPAKTSITCHQCAIEFNEIHSSISQFISLDNTEEDIVRFSAVINDQILVWLSLSISIPNRFHLKAKKECVNRNRKHTIKKNDSMV